MARVESWLVKNGQEVRRGRAPRYFAWDFQLGVQEPTLANTGCFRVPEASLSNYAGDVTNVAKGEVISGLNITGTFRPNNQCTLRDSIIRGGPAPTYGTTHTLFSARQSGTEAPIRAEYVSILPSHPSVDVYGFEWGGIDAYRCLITGVVDGASVHGSGNWPNTIHKSVKFHACMFMDSPYYPTDPRQTDGSHNDFIQAHGSLSLLEVVGCSFGAVGQRAAACVLVQQNHGTYSGPIRITDNWFYGHKSKGAVFNTSESRGQSYTNLEFWRNRIDPESSHASPAPILVKSTSRYPECYGMEGAVGSAPGTWTPGPNANVYMGTGLYVPIKSG